MLVLGHLLISAEQVAGGTFTPADPTAADKEKQVASLDLAMSGGNVITVTDDAALFLFDYLVEHHGTRIDKAQAGSITVSKEAVNTLKQYFNRVEYSSSDFFSCKAIVDQLASRI